MAFSGAQITTLAPDGYTGPVYGRFTGKGGSTAGGISGNAPAGLNLPPALYQYNMENEQQTRTAIRAADAENFKRGRDLRLEQGERFILKSADGTRWSVTVSNAGVITLTAIS